MTLERAYKLAGVTKPLALHKRYCELEQPRFVKRIWDYDNPRLLHNRIKSEIEEINLDDLKEKERDWCREILWYWHHHAISCAFWKGDQAAARLHAAKALSYQDADHPNKITQLLFYLVHDQIEEAKSWALHIDDDVEGPSAVDLIEGYEHGQFIWTSK